MKKIIVFDLDDTLALSKSALDEEMSSLLVELLKKKKVSIISGGDFPQFEKQVINRLSCPKELLSNLIIFPVKGGAMYKFENNTWQIIYSKAFTDEEKAKIIMAVNTVANEVDFLSEIPFGERLEDRNSEFTFSALGQNAPHDEKKKWDPGYVKRKILEEKLKKLLPEFDVAIGGSTSIDITPQNVNKAFAINQIITQLHFKIEEILFVGDSLFKDGNDYSVIQTGVETIAVKNIDETKKIIREQITN